MLSGGGVVMGVLIGEAVATTPAGGVDVVAAAQELVTSATPSMSGATNRQ
jgi:hypothetical protein